jgi:hypothetical protein
MDVSLKTDYISNLVFSMIQSIKDWKGQQILLSGSIKFKWSWSAVVWIDCWSVKSVLCDNHHYLISDSWKKSWNILEWICAQSQWSRRFLFCAFFIRSAPELVSGPTTTVTLVRVRVNSVDSSLHCFVIFSSFCWLSPLCWFDCLQTGKVI